LLYEFPLAISKEIEKEHLSGDRIKFKLCDAEQYFNKLKEIDKKHNNTPKGNVNSEMEITFFCSYSRIKGLPTCSC